MRDRRILGIDPGLTRCGIGVVDVAADRATTMVHVGVARTPASLALERRLLRIGDVIEAALDRFKPDVCSIERVFTQHNLGTVMGVAQISGIALRECARRGVAVEFHTPTEAKAAVTGYGGANKTQVTAMVQRVLRLDAPPKPADAADALALALCAAWRPAGAEMLADERTPEPLTGAQRAWRAAEQHGRTSRARSAAQAIRAAGAARAQR